MEGLAPDGGLYVPAQLGPIGADALAGLRAASLVDAAVSLGRRLLGEDVEEAPLEAAVRNALGFPIPLTRLTERKFVLELFHGPTLAFKDVGARVLAQLMGVFHEPDEPPLTVLTATSGDTGGAVAHAFFGMPWVRVVVLYPAGQVSALQERQFTTLGGNVTAAAVQGTFDDCQRLAKAAFADRELRQALRLTSANSINVGRWLPQVFYYFHGWAQLPSDTDELLVAVPSGNFGNLSAGLLAKRLGLPVTVFVAATNANDVVPRYLHTGRFAPRASVRTISTAMDVGNPSNLDRMLALYDGDVEGLRRDVVGSAHDDGETKRAMAEVFARFGYVLDPHTAVGYLALERALEERPRAVGMLLATAHPAKFNDVVAQALGKPVPVPPRLAASLSREPRSVPLEPTLPRLAELLCERPPRAGSRSGTR